MVGFILAFSISKAITKPINYLREIIDRLGKGDLVKFDKSKISNDEIGDMAKSLSNMADGFGEITIFAENIGNGKYDSEFKPLSESDMLGNALLDMRANLKKVAEEDKKRKSFRNYFEKDRISSWLFMFSFFWPIPVLSLRYALKRRKLLLFCWLSEPVFIICAGGVLIGETLFHAPEIGQYMYVSAHGIYGITWLFELGSKTHVMWKKRRLKQRNDRIKMYF